MADRNNANMDVSRGEGLKLSVFYDHVIQASEQTGKTLPELLREVRAAGIEAVEINMTYLAEHEETLDLLGQADLKVSCVYEFYEMDRRNETEKAGKHIEVARNAGAELALVVPGFFAEETETFGECIGSQEKACKFLDGNEKALRMAEGLAEITAMGAEAGVRVVIEDFDDVRSPISCIHGMKWFLERIPDLKVTFDTGNFITHKEDIFAAWQALRDRVIHVHCKDRGVQSVAVGDGYLPMTEILTDIMQSGYRGYFAIEHFDAPDQESSSCRSAAKIQEIASISRSS